MVSYLVCQVKVNRKGEPQDVKNEVECFERWRGTPGIAPLLGRGVCTVGSGNHEVEAYFLVMPFYSVCAEES